MWVTSDQGSPLACLSHNQSTFLTFSSEIRNSFDVYDSKLKDSICFMTLSSCGLSSKKFKSKNLKLKRGQESFETAICGGSHGELVAIKRKTVLGILD